MRLASTRLVAAAPPRPPSGQPLATHLSLLFCFFSSILLFVFSFPPPPYHHHQLISLDASLRHAAQALAEERAEVAIMGDFLVALDREREEARERAERERGEREQQVWRRGWCWFWLSSV